MKTSLVLLMFLVAAAPAFAAGADSCSPPPSFVDIAPPAIAPADQLVAHTETIVIDRKLSTVLESVDKPLRDAVHSTSSLPGVAGDYPLTPGGFGAPGSRRMVCLTDGSTLEEQVLEKQRSDNSYRFRYEVWHYTTEKARPISYAVGEFNYTQTAPDQTRVVWTYAFALNRERFPGYLGSFGDFLFRVGFLDRQYAELMRDTLSGQKRDAEAQKSLADK